MSRALDRALRADAALAVYDGALAVLLGPHRHRRARLAVYRVLGARRIAEKREIDAALAVRS